MTTDVGLQFVENLTLKKTTYLFKSSASYKLLGSCNGLVLLGLNHQLKLWNPSVRKCVKLPLPRPFRDTKLILGYAPHTGDYKVVSLNRSGWWNREVTFGIYSLNCDLWTTKIFEKEGPISDFTERIGFIYFQGAAYWYDYGNQIAFFDFDTEELSYVVLPDVHSSYGELNAWRVTRCLFLLGESLAVFSVSSTSSSVWVMEKDGVKRSWSLWFSGDSSTEYNRSIKDQGEFLYFSPSRILFVENSGTSFLYGKNSGMISNQRFQSLGKATTPFIALEPYIESLVLSRGYGGRTTTLSWYGTRLEPNR